MKDIIKIKGAREHNLKNIDIEIPRDELVVFTGLSGSGKSSLAFDTIYAEGQRRYVESLSSYARQFLGQMDKPDVDYIDGLSPAISIDQKTTSQNPRSTVGTVTEIYDYLRLLWARIGTPHCPKCGKEIHQQTIDQIIDRLMALPEKTRVQLLAPVIRGKKGEHSRVFEDARRQGYVRVRVDGEVHDLSEEFKLAKTKKHSIEIVVDRVVIRPDARGRITDSVETACALSGGLLIADVIGGDELRFSQNYACDDCGISIEELTPRMFSFNNPYGACPVCTGLGIQKVVDPDRVIPNRRLSIKQGAIRATGWTNAEPGSISYMYYTALGRKHGFSLETPIEELSGQALDELLYGTGDEVLELSVSRISGGVMRQPFEGIIPNLERRYRETNSDWSRGEIEEVMSESPCPACHGRRLRPEVLAVTLGGLNIAEFAEKSVVKAMEFLHTLRLSEMQHKIGDRVIKEIMDRLGFLQSVGLEYLTLSRSSGTLSGGESQRIRLATQIGSSLVGVLYILDEPSIGLHQRDNDKLLATLKRLRDLGNTLIVVEHDEDTMFAADHIVDIGPGAGRNGGEVVFQGTVDELLQERFHHRSVSLRPEIHPRARGAPQGQRQKAQGKGLRGQQPQAHRLYHSARHADLRDRRFRLRQVLVRGRDPLQETRRRAERRKNAPGCVRRHRGTGKPRQGHRHRPVAHRPHAALQSGDLHGRVQRHPRSVRQNGRCEGARLRPEPLLLQRQGRPLRGMLGRRPAQDRNALPAGRLRPLRRLQGPPLQQRDARGALQGQEYLRGARHDGGRGVRVLRERAEDRAASWRRMREVGLGYVKLGQSSTTLSGGEAQRAKLATELSKRSTGRTIYILDEPTTGLHIADVHRLVDVLQKLVDAGNTVVVIEHNLDVIKVADYILDLGPEGGDGGGRLVASGTPEEVAQCEKSYTGRYLGPVLAKTKAAMQAKSE